MRDRCGVSEKERQDDRARGRENVRWMRSHVSDGLDNKQINDTTCGFRLLFLHYLLLHRIQQSDRTSVCCSSTILAVFTSRCVCFGCGSQIERDRQTDGVAEGHRELEIGI